VNCSRFVAQIVLASCLVVARLHFGVSPPFFCCCFLNCECSILKLLFYTSVIATEMEPERASHFFEFTGEMVNSAWAFIFALQVFAKLSNAQEHHNLLLAKDE
jgi:hypothetical protein